MIIVERATEDDFADILAIDSLVMGDDSRRGYLIKAIMDRQCIVARVGEVRLGYAVVNRAFYDQHFIALVIVHPDYRRRGIARALISYAEKTCPNEKIFTSTNESNTVMQSVCAALGYVKSGFIENLDDGDPEIIYVKYLRRATTQEEIRIMDLKADNRRAIEQAAKLLVEGFREDWPDAWPDMVAALEEVWDCLGQGRICRMAVDGDGNVLGWIGGRPEYDGNVWELHPLVVREDQRGKGIGRSLVRDLEERVRERAGLTLTLGTDDETNMTSLGGVDLYPDVWQHLRKIKSLKRHPFEFYRKMGFVITGVVPDANGPGKPDLYMSKRVGQQRELSAVEQEIEAGLALERQGREQEAIEHFKALVERYPGDARVRFEYAGAYDFAGQEAAAIPYYEEAIRLGLTDDILKRAYLQLGSSLRNVGKTDEAVRLLGEACSKYPDYAPLKVFYALALHDAGRHAESAAELMQAAVIGDMDGYERAIRSYAAELTPNS